MTDMSITLHAFQHKLCDTLVEYQVTKMSGQTMIWVGAGEQKLSNISTAVPVQDFPSTAVIGQQEQASNLSSRLAKKLNKQVRNWQEKWLTRTYRLFLIQVFVSYNIPEDNILTPLVIEKLVAEIKLHPDKF